MRLLGQPAEGVERPGRHTQLVQRDRPSAAVEEPQHDRLAVQRGDGRDAQVQLALLQPHADPAVLRYPSLGDVELREQLDAGDDRRLESLRRARQLGQDPIHPEPGHQTRSRGLQVNVRGTSLVGFADEQVDEADDGGLVGEVPGVGELVIPRVGHRPELGVEILHELEHGLRRSERAPDALEQVLSGNGDDLDRNAVGQLEIVQHFRRRLACDRHAEAVRRDLQGQNLMVLEVLRFERLGHRQLGDERSGHSHLGTQSPSLPRSAWHHPQRIPAVKTRACERPLRQVAARISQP